MKLEFPIDDAHFVLSKDELCYQQVLDEFSFAKQILILTFNISGNENRLVDAIRKLPASVQVTIVTNIPSRWEQYFGDTYVKRAQKNIQMYKAKLDPKGFSPKTGVYFCFENHAKIIATDTIAYLGSSNYSDESQSNFECGVITRSTEFIKYLEMAVFPVIIEKSREFESDDRILANVSALQSGYTELLSIKELFITAMYRLNDHHGMNLLTYNNSDPALSIYNIEQIENQLDQLLKILRENIEFLDSVDYDEIENIEEKIGFINDRIQYIHDLFEGSLYELASFSADNCIDEYIAENSAEAYDEYLDSYMDKAMDIANDQVSMLADDAENDTNEIFAMKT